ncbi:helix-turn-helix transcriptional regulator [Anaerosporobacter sp.]|uniref:helix-turn-helix transcriptional regulator n=1 Tax=Anaerosporobacter sp. TaxID=1872529 RepID=UPI00286EC5F7|nr:AraC family transcriptional regulator [Anaerosporobacter sp.]
MITIDKIGENATHDNTFTIDRPTGHPVYLLLLIKTSARFLINDTWHTTTPHVAVVFKPGQRHRYHAIEPSYIDNWAHIRSDHPLFGEHFPFGTPITLHNTKDYYDLFHIICTEYYGASSHRNLIIHNLTTALLDKISDESNTNEYPDLYYALTELREQIYSYPNENWTLPMMAKQLNISTGYLHSIYPHFFETTCMKDVIQSRLQRACELLISNNKPLDEIAKLCGYQYTEHFIRQFKSYMGITPGKYRKNYLSTNKDFLLTCHDPLTIN